MSRRKSELARPDYRPELGELVRDLLHGGAVGAYMGTVGGRIYLRRPDGGIEWTTYPSEIEPAGSVDGPATVTGAA
ncbi:hypothetical protein ACFVUH_25200 [Kitasatospora sp. NPDC058032]|uniref:hypothetical protein n=1 Tax=Kitasatospora sp. NPDC058032 TaxID=3346307 RepID=UPI0036DF4F88